MFAVTHNKHPEPCHDSELNVWEPSGPVAEGAEGKSDESTNSHNERLKRCVDIPSRSLLLWGVISSPIASFLLLPLETCCQPGCTLSSGSTHTSGKLKICFMCLSIPPETRICSAASCAVSKMCKMLPCSTAHFRELGLIQNFGWFKMRSQLGLVTNIVPLLCRMTAYGCDRVNGVSPQLA